MKRSGLIIPAEFKGKIDENLLKKIQEYEAEKTRFSFVSSIFGNVTTVLFLFGGGLRRRRTGLHMNCQKTRKLW